MVSLPFCSTRDIELRRLRKGGRQQAPPLVVLVAFRSSGGHPWGVTDLSPSEKKGSSPKGDSLT
jgi:hypothetical protein